VDDGETNVSRVSFHVLFIRNQAFQLSLDSRREHHAGPYSLIYHWDGTTWSTYNSLDILRARDPIETNVESVVGSGIALSYDLVPFVPNLLCVTEGFRGFRGLAEGDLFMGETKQVRTAQAVADQLNGRAVYRLTLTRKVAGYDDLEHYWIDARSYAILKRESRHTAPQRYASLVVRKSVHAPRMNALAPNTPIVFKPPASPPMHAALARNCIVTLKQIQQAKEVWALENRKTEKDLPAQSELFGPQGYMQKIPLCPQGGIYTIGSVGEPPRCSVTGHTLQR
jgi:hypothetical protein